MALYSCDKCHVKHQRNTAVSLDTTIVCVVFPVKSENCCVDIIIFIILKKPYVNNV